MNGTESTYFRSRKFMTASITIYLVLHSSINYIVLIAVGSLADGKVQELNSGLLPVCRIPAWGVLSPIVKPSYNVSNNDRIPFISVYLFVVVDYYFTSRYLAEPTKTPHKSATSTEPKINVTKYIFIEKGRSPWQVVDSRWVHINSAKLRAMLHAFWTFRNSAPRHSREL